MARGISNLILAACLIILVGTVQQARAGTVRLSIATAGTTGVFYTYGGALASLISRYVPDVEVTAEATGGSVENMRLLNNKQADLATTSADVVYQCYYDYKNSKYFKDQIKVEALFNMYNQPHHIIALADGGVKSIADMKGKRVVVGSPGSGTEVKTKMILKAMGLTYKDFTPEFLSFGEGTEALQDKNVAAAFLGVSYPAPAVVNLSLTTPIRLIALTDDEIGKIIKAYPFLSRTVIPGKTYKGVDNDTQTVSVQTLVVCRPDLPPDLAYKIVKAVFEHKDELNMIHSSFKQTTLEHATPTIVPVSPGAKKYYEEKGVYKENKK